MREVLPQHFLLSILPFLSVSLVSLSLSLSLCLSLSLRLSVSPSLRLPLSVILFSAGCIEHTISTQSIQFSTHNQPSSLSLLFNMSELSFFNTHIQSNVPDNTHTVSTHSKSTCLCRDNNVSNCLLQIDLSSPSVRHGTTRPASHPMCTGPASTHERV